MTDWDDQQDREYWQLERGPTTSDYGRAIWAEHRDAQNPYRREEPLLRHMLSGPTDTPREPTEGAGAFEGSSLSPAAPQRPAETPARRAPDRPRYMTERERQLTPERFRRPCKVCGEPLSVDAPANRTMHTTCGERIRKRRYRAALKAKQKELKQMLGLEPIDDA